MARVILHIGAHKTGTSYLQALFHQNRKRLEKAGIHYPWIGPNNAHHALAGSWIDTPGVPPDYFGKGGLDAVWDNLVATYAKAPGTLFLSAENLSAVTPPRRVDMAELASRLSAFEEVRVVYTLRQQPALLQAVWLQIAKTERAPKLKPFVQNALQTRRADRVPLDHRSQYHMLSRGFAPEQIFLVDYEQARRADGGLAQVFLDLMDAGLKASDLTRPPDREANISPDPLAFFMAVTIARRDVPSDHLVDIARAIIASAASGPTTLLARHEYAKLRARYTNSNARLAEQVQPYQPGFDFADPPPPDDMFYCDDLHQQHWIDIASALYAPQAGGRSKELVGRLLRRVRPG